MAEKHYSEQQYRTKGNTNHQNISHSHITTTHKIAHIPETKAQSSL